jgi:surface antigen
MCKSNEINPAIEPTFKRTKARLRRRIGGLGLVAAFLPMGACDTALINKQQAGTLIGGAAGAVGGYTLGKEIGGTQGKILGGVLGAATGAWIGSRIGASLDEIDRQKLAEATQHTAVTGQPEKWHNPDTGVTVQTKVASTTTKTEPVTVPVLKDRVQEVPPLELIGMPYQAKGSTNVRGGPGTDYKVVGALHQGQAIPVVGKVKGRDWFMVGEGGAGSGFVSTSLLEPLPSGAAPPPPQAPAGAVETKTVRAERVCRTVEQVVIDAHGKETTERVTACQGPNGWEVV